MSAFGGAVKRADREPQWACSVTIVESPTVSPGGTCEKSFVSKSTCRTMSVQDKAHGPGVDPSGVEPSEFALSRPVSRRGSPTSRDKSGFEVEASSEVAASFGSRDASLDPSPHATTIENMKDSVNARIRAFVMLPLSQRIPRASRPRPKTPTGFGI